jgi:hypothetical protein
LLRDVLDGYLVGLVERAGPSELVERRVRAWQATAGTALAERPALFTAGTAAAA